MIYLAHPPLPSFYRALCKTQTWDLKWYMNTQRIHSEYTVNNYICWEIHANVLEKFFKLEFTNNICQFLFPSVLFWPWLVQVSFCIFPLVVLTFNLPLLAIRGGIFHQELFHLLCFLYLSIAISFILLTIRGGVYLQELDCIFVLSKANPELGKNQI